MWARVVNHGGMLLEDGQIIADTEGLAARTRGRSRWSVPGRHRRDTCSRRRGDVARLHRSRGSQVVGDARDSTLGG